MRDASPTLQSHAILILDDDPLVRRAFGRALRALGALVIEADTILAADAALGTTEFHVILCDLHLTPPDRGDQYLKLVEKRWPKMRRVLCTSDTRSAARCADAYVDKPCSVAELLQAIAPNDK